MKREWERQTEREREREREREKITEIIFFMLIECYVNFTDPWHIHMIYKKIKR